MPKNPAPSSGPNRAGQPFVLGKRDRGGGDPKEMVARGRRALEEKRVWEAEEIARSVLAKNPDFAPGQVLMGLVAGQTGNVRFSMHMLEKGLSKGVEDPKARDALANIYFKSGRVNEAEAIWVELRSRRPEMADVHHGLGQVYLLQNKGPEAVESFMQSVRLAPNVAFYHHNLARAFEMTTRIPDAMAAYRRAISLAPESPRSYPNLAVLLLLNNQNKPAIEAFRKAYELDPNSSDGIYYLAQALSEEDNLTEAEVQVRRAIQLNPNSARPYILLGTVLQQLGRFSEAKEVFLKSIDLNPTLTGPYSAMATGLKFTEEDRHIIDRMNAVLENPNLNRTALEQVHYALGKAYSDLKEYQLAMHHYDQANHFAASRHADFGHKFQSERETAFVDRISAMFTREFFESNRDLGNDSDRPVFVVGMIRSGTTLTEQILSSHPQVAGAGELRFWIERVPTANNGAPWILNKEAAERLAPEYLATLETAAPGSPRATDKMPLNFLTLGFIHTILPNARIIHCRRNPIDNCLSIYMTQYKGSPEFGHVKENIVYMYKEYERLMAHWRSVIPADRFLEVNYEDLVANQEHETRRMIDFIGLEWDDACLHHEKNESSVRTPSLWQVRQPIYTTSVEKWRRYEPWLGAFAELQNR